MTTSYYSAADKGAELEYCNEGVCLCVCQRSYRQNYTSDLRQFFLSMSPMAVARSSPGGVDHPALCTSGFVDDVIFAHKPIARRRRPAEAQCTRSLGPGYKLCAVIPAAGQRTHETTFRALKVTSQVATPGAESAVYNCLAITCRSCTTRLSPQSAQLTCLLWQTS